MEGPCGAHRTQVGCAEGGCRNLEPAGALLEVAEIVWTGRGPRTRARAEIPNLGVPPGAAVSRSNPAALHPPFASALCVLLLFTFAFSSAFFPPVPLSQPCPSLLPPAAGARQSAVGTLVAVRGQGRFAAVLGGCSFFPASRQVWGEFPGLLRGCQRGSQQQRCRAADGCN